MDEKSPEFVRDDVRPLASTPSSSVSGGISGDETPDSSTTIPMSLVCAENYLTITEGSQSTLTVQELQEAIIQCKTLVLDSAECSEERKWLVRRLIELRYRLVLAKEAAEDLAKGIQPSPETKVVLGHHFTLHYRPTSTTKRHCDRCCGAIWSVVQSWYQCSDCQYRAHTKCVNRICRVCAHLRASENPFYELRICPEIGLGAQGYQCAECKTDISFKNSWMVPRLCDYDGLYYCASCHWNNSAVVPARIVHNWDFEQYYVSRASYQLLRITKSRPLIKLDPRLYAFVEELGQVKKLRQDILLMKTYLVTCREAREQKLVWHQFSDRTHFLQDSEMFSLRDLVEINAGTLVPQLESAINIFIKHIKQDCAICSGQGYICELCDDKDVVFPFDPVVISCPKCHWVHHKSCWTKKQICPKCQRIEKRNQQSKESETFNDTVNIS